jgi:hypothetical protein
LFGLENSPGCIREQDVVALRFVDHGRNSLGVMRGLDPRIHDEMPLTKALRKSAFAEKPHGFPGQARQ